MGFLRRVASAVVALAVSFPLASMAAPPPPPVEAYAGPAVISGINLSPDGRFVAYQSPVNGQSALVIAPLIPDPATPPVVVPSDEDWSVIGYDWMNNERLIVTAMKVEKVNGPERKVPARFTRMIAINRDGSNIRVLVQPNRRSLYRLVGGAGILHYIDDQHVLVAYPMGTDPWPDIVKVNVYTGQATRVMRGRNDIDSYIPDASGVIRIGMRYSDRTQTWTYLYRRSADEQFRTFKEVSLEKDPVFDVVGVAKDDPDLIYVSSTHATDKAAIYEYNMATGQFGRMIHSDPDHDVTGLFSRRNEVKGIAYTQDMPVRIWFDPERQKLQERLDAAIPDSIEQIVEQTEDKRYTLLVSFHPSQPTAYYLFDAETRQMTFFADTFPKIPQEALGTRTRVDYAARDGLNIPAYLTLPPGRDPKNLPFIVMPHGGPIARDDLGFDTLSQFLASRGYAVLQPNFRGSDGYGDSFRRGGFQEWGGKMQQDVIDGVNWAVAQGIADPDRMCIVGWSYGGYAALIGAVQSSDLFKCAIATAPVSNLPRLYRELSWSSFATDYNRGIFFGSDDAKLREVSPAHQAHRVNIPVQIIHGDMDVQAFVQHGRDMEDALKDAGKSVEYIEIDNMDHSAVRTKEMVTVLSAWERFLAQHIGN